MDEGKYIKVLEVKYVIDWGIMRNLMNLLCSLFKIFFINSFIQISTTFAYV